MHQSEFNVSSDEIATLLQSLNSEGQVYGTQTLKYKLRILMYVTFVGLLLDVRSVLYTWYREWQASSARAERRTIKYYQSGRNDPKMQ